MQELSKIIMKKRVNWATIQWKMMLGYFIIIR